MASDVSFGVAAGFFESAPGGMGPGLVQPLKLDSITERSLMEQFSEHNLQPERFAECGWAPAADWLQSKLKKVRRWNRV
jgi:hypothetical protein